MRPQNGTRFTLDLVSADQEVVYRFRAEGSRTTSAGLVRLDPTVGRPRFDGEEPVPPMVGRQLTALLRALWRPRADGTTRAAWPRRITRWRDVEPGDGA